MKVVDMHLVIRFRSLFYRMEEGKEHSVWKNDCHVDLGENGEGGLLSPEFCDVYVAGQVSMKPFEYCMKLVDLFYRRWKNSMGTDWDCEAYEDILENQRLGRKMSAMLTIEEGGVCQGETAFLRDFYRVGVRMMTLTWNFKNELGWPNIIRIEGDEAYFEPDTEHG